MIFDSDFPVELARAASTDESRPVLTKVLLQVYPRPPKPRRKGVRHEPQAGILTATNSYIAAQVRVTFDEAFDTPPKPGDYLVDAKAFARKKYVHHTLKGMELTLVVDGNTQETYQLEPAEGFPNIEQFFPENVTQWEVGLNGPFLALLARALGSEALRLRFTVDAKGEPLELRPMIVEPIGADGVTRGLIMPVKLPDAVQHRAQRDAEEAAA